MNSEKLIVFARVLAIVAVLLFFIPFGFYKAIMWGGAAVGVHPGFALFLSLAATVISALLAGAIADEWGDGIAKPCEGESTDRVYPDGACRFHPKGCPQNRQHSEGAAS